MGLTVSESLWFLPFVAPLCFFIAWNDMRVMKIPNWSVLALAAIFVVIGPLALPFTEYLWRLPQGLVVLVIGILANATRMMGAGDAKFIAAAALFVVPYDAMNVAIILCGTTLAGFATHRIARATFGRKLAPDWQSWATGRRFPMGFPLGAALVVYLAAPLF